MSDKSSGSMPFIVGYVLLIAFGHHAAAQTDSPLTRPLLEIPPPPPQLPPEFWQEPDSDADLGDEDPIADDDPLFAMIDAADGLKSFEDGDLDKAKQCYAKALEKDAQWAHAWSMLGTVHLTAGRSEAAHEAFARAQGLDPQSAETREQAGTVFAKRGQHERAVMEFQSAAYLDPKRPGPWFGMAASYEASGRHDWAIGAFDRFLRINPQGEWARKAEERISQLKNPTTK